MSTTPILEAIELKKSYQTPHLFSVLNGINLTLFKGQSVAIIGKSGEGKSTLLHLLGTLDNPTSGTLKICGQSVQDASSETLATLRNLKIGFIFQSWNLLEEYTLLDNLLMPVKISGNYNEKTASEKALQLLDYVGLSHRKSFLAKTLSGGEKQRAAIARAFMNDPSLILADEPSGNLDSASSKQIHQLLIDSSKKFNKALIIVTHDRDLAALCDMQYLLEGGLLKGR